MRAGWLFLFSLVLSVATLAQTPKFCFGPRVALGSSQYVDLPASCRSGVSFQLGIVACWQFSNFFALEFSPTTTVYGGQIEMSTSDGVDSRGVARIFPYRDIYHIYAMEFPAFMKWSVGGNSVRSHFFIGPGIGFTMGGTHSKRYDDDMYNSDNGYNGHSMRGLKSSYGLGVIGAGVEFKMKKLIFGIDLRIGRTSQIAALDGSRFSARTTTIGMSWKFN